MLSNLCRSSARAWRHPAASPGTGTAVRRFLDVGYRADYAARAATRKTWPPKPSRLRFRRQLHAFHCCKGTMQGARAGGNASLRASKAATATAIAAAAAAATTRGRARQAWSRRLHCRSSAHNRSPQCRAPPRMRDSNTTESSCVLSAGVGAAASATVARRELAARAVKLQLASMRHGGMAEPEGWGAAACLRVRQQGVARDTFAVRDRGQGAYRLRVVRRAPRD